LRLSLLYQLASWFWRDEQRGENPPEGDVDGSTRLPLKSLDTMV
jgi:hypothetical protein